MRKFVVELVGTNGHADHVIPTLNRIFSTVAFDPAQELRGRQCFCAARAPSTVFCWLFFFESTEREKVSG